MSNVSQGECLCGAVQAEGKDASGISICHCRMCRRWHGGPSFAIKFDGGLKITKGAENVGWYKSSDWAERGFCKTCGSTLFYRLSDDPTDISGESGTFDLPNKLPVIEHYFIDQKPDFYDFEDDAPRLTTAEVMARYGMTPDGEPR